MVRAQQHIDGIELVEPITMADAPIANLNPPRMETTADPLLIAGLGQRYSCENNAGMPPHWRRFQPCIGTIHGQVGRAAYGVICNADNAGDVDYVCGVEVPDFSDLPDEFVRLRIPPQSYAIFVQRDHISAIRSTFVAIWNKWLPESGHKAIEAPFFERYGDTFDPRTGTGDVEIWIPIETTVG